MKPLTYPAIALIVNLILFNGFPMAGGGVSLGALLTIPIIAIVSFLLTGIHYLLQRKKVKTKYFQIGGIVAMVFLSYSLFITDKGNTPIDIIGRMFKTAGNYKRIELSDYFLEQLPQNQEKILAAKKKFKTQLPDTAYTINVINPTDYSTTESIGIYYKNKVPIAVNKNVEIQRLNHNAIRLTRINNNDTLRFILSPLEIKIGESRISGFPEENRKGKDKKTLRSADIDPISKYTTLDREFLIYQFFYWLL